MKNYIQRIIRLFATSDPDPKLTGEIHRWLLDQEHAGLIYVLESYKYGCGPLYICSCSKFPDFPKSQD